jgi:hypothetical protein
MSDRDLDRWHINVMDVMQKTVAAMGAPWFEHGLEKTFTVTVRATVNSKGELRFTDMRGVADK